MLLKRIDEILAIFNYFKGKLILKDTYAISALVIFLCVLILHFIKGLNILFILDACVLISFYKSFKNLYLNEHYPK